MIFSYSQKEGLCSRVRIHEYLFAVELLVFFKVLIGFGLGLQNQNE